MHQRTAGQPKNEINHVHVGYLCEAHEKILLVIDILLKDKPDSSIIFCNTSECVDFVRKYLQRCGFIVPRAKRSIVVTSDDRVRHERQRYHCVINFDLPFALRNYSTRLDLLARKDNGRCISLLCDYYSDFAPPIIARYQLQCSWPAADFSDYRLPDRNTVNAWLELEREGDKERKRGKKSARREQPSRDRGERGKRPHRSYEVNPRGTKKVSYASRKADQIVATKSQRKSVWERILSFLTR